MSQSVANYLLANLAVLTEPLRHVLSQSRGHLVLEGGAGESEVLRVQAANGEFVACHGRDPRREAAQWLDAVATSADGRPDALPSLMFVVGLSFGYLLDEIERRSDTARVIALEPDPEAVRWMLGRRDWREWLTTGRLTILLGPDYTGTSSIWQSLGESSSDPPIVVHPVIARLRSQDVVQAHKAYRRVLFDAQANREARQRLGSIYLLNTLRNIGAIAQEGDVASLADRFRGVPAVLIGAGPSLDRNLESLRTIADRALVIAADTAFRPLNAAGIAPHIVIAADPTEANARHVLLGQVVDPDVVERIWLVAEGSVAAWSLQVLRGQTFTFRISDHEPWPWLAASGLSRGKLSIWGSVLTAALDLAVRAGCNPIIFAGSDLAYTDGRPYCSFTSFEEDLPRGEAFGSALEAWRRDEVQRFSLETITDVNGLPTTTAPHLMAFRDWILDQAAALEDHEFINTTGAGILHGGRIAQSTLETALDGRPSRDDIQEILHEAHRTSAPSASSRKAVFAVAQGGPSEDQLRTWIDFTEGTVRSDQLREAVDEGLAALSGRQRQVDVSYAAWRHLPPTCFREFCEALGHLAASESTARPESETRLEEVQDPFLPPRGPDPLLPLAWAPLVVHELPSERLEPDAGRCFRFRFRSLAGRYFSFSAIHARLALYEDGQRLPKSGSLHDEIRQVGEGRYSMWPGVIYFSSTDGSDPRRSGRVYHTLVPSYVRFLEQLPDSIITRFGL